MSDVKLGIGLATGMFYHAPLGTAFPSYPAETLAAAWKKVGDVTSDGISLTLDKSTDSLKNWANVIKRIVLSDHTESINAPIMDTTQEVFETILGKSNVTYTPASGAHGNLVKAHLSGGIPDPEEFLFLMKDGDDMIAIALKGQIMSMADVTFAPGSGITWTPTITVIDDSLDLIMDDGDASS